MGFAALLRESSAAKDFDAIERLAHELKGSAGNVQADGVERLAAMALAKARHRNHEALDDALALAAELEQAIEVLRAGAPTPAA